MGEFVNLFGSTISQFQFILMILMVILHVFIAAGIARDVGQLQKRQLAPLFLPGSVWVLAGLLSGLLGLLVYWLIHHSSLSR